MQPTLTSQAIPPRPSLWLKFRTAFVTGLFLLAPVGVCAFVLKSLLDKIGNPASQLFFGWMEGGPPNSPLENIILSTLSILIVVAFITVLGYASHYLLGRWLLRRFEKLILHVPILSPIYRTTKQIVDTFHNQQKAGFDSVVMIEYPRAGLYSIGFITKPVEGEMLARAGEGFVNVFIPTTPLPTNGFLVLSREKDLIRLDMSVADGMKLIISGGAITPSYPGHARKLPPAQSAN